MVGGGEKIDRTNKITMPVRKSESTMKMSINDKIEVSQKESKAKMTYIIVAIEDLGDTLLLSLEITDPIH